MCLYKAQISGERLQDHWPSGIESVNTFKVVFYKLIALLQSELSLTLHPNFEIIHITNEHRYKKTSFSHMQKKEKRRRSDAQC